MNSVSLEPKQALDFQTQATETLYGGAAGGGKSYGKRVSAIRWCVEVPGIQVYFFRRTLPDLRDNHLRGPTAFQVMLSGYLKSGHVKYRSVENEFEFWNGSILHLCYCDSENDVEKYRGAEIHVLIIDELTHFSEYQYRFLRSRVRIAGLTVPEVYKGRLPRIETASNPGSIGHAWVKRTFVTPKAPNEIWRTSPDEGGMLRQFIPARLDDNPHLTKDDPTYRDRLMGLGTDSLVRAMLEGDWDIIAGQAFEKLRKDTHCITPFTPPEDWLVFGSLDWGSSRPFSYGLWAISNGDALEDGRRYQAGSMIRFDEWYGWNGKPNEGLRMEVREVAQGILKLENDRKPAYRVGDSSMWDVDGGPSIAERFNNNGVIMKPAPKGKGSRHNGYVEVRNRIKGNEEPMLYATSNCYAGFWRTMPEIVLDAHKWGIKSEAVDTDQEDHCFAVGTRTVLGVVGQDQYVINQYGMTTGLKTRVREAETVRLIFDDGEKVICTPDHKFYTEDGWIEAKDLMDEVCYNALSQRREEWFRSLVLSGRNFLERIIIFVDGIFNARASACIALSGNPLMDLYQTAGISIIGMKTARIIKSRILSCYDKAITCAFTQNSTISRGSCHSLRSKQENGMDQKKDWNFIQDWLKKTGSRCVKTQWRNVVRFVVRLTQRLELSRTSLFIAAMCAGKSRCVGVEPSGKVAVTCLNVPKGNAFALESGILVHNCSDEVMYACMSRPWQRHVEVQKEPVDRWFRLEPKEEATWRTA